MTRPGIEPRPPGPLANTLTAGPMSRFIHIHTYIYREYLQRKLRGSCGVMIIVIGNGHGDMSSNPDDFITHSTYILGKDMNPIYSLQLWVNSSADWVLQPW